MKCEKCGFSFVISDRVITIGDKRYHDYCFNSLSRETRKRELAEFVASLQRRRK